MKVRVEYDPTPIRHIAVQCPKCESWFNGRDITKHALRDSTDIYFAEFECPVCNNIFGSQGCNSYSDVSIEEVGYPEVYDGILQKKVSWE